MTASTLRNEMVKEMKRLGLREHSRASTKGALRVWLSNPQKLSIKDLRKGLAQYHPVLCKLYSGRLELNGCEDEASYTIRQDKDMAGNYLLIVYRAGHAGTMCMFGFDC